MNTMYVCMANKIINNSQLTICWYVDDMNISHINESEVIKMIESITKKFGKMNVSRGLSHTYLGIDFTKREKKVEIIMKAYLQEFVLAI